MLLQSVLLAALAVQEETAGLEFFEKRVRPVLIDACGSCHSGAAKNLKGGLILDTPEGLDKGGDTGPVDMPGKPDDSLLIKAVRYQDPDLQMPPKKRLPEKAVADLTTWGRMGAPRPKAASTAEGKDGRDHNPHGFT